MTLTHRTHRSEWDDAYLNVRVSAGDARRALVVIAVFLLVALLI